MKYTIVIDRQAFKYLSKLPAKIKSQIKRKIDDLAENPRPHGYIELKGGKGYFRIRSGDYRIIYKIADDILIVTVLEIGDRREIYR
jgi:mRNA interferase RelE/StbE